MENIARKVEELSGIHDWYFCEDRREKQVRKELRFRSSLFRP
jgi:hypothetical protein